MPFSDLLLSLFLSPLSLSLSQVLLLHIHNAKLAKHSKLHALVILIAHVKSLMTFCITFLTLIIRNAQFCEIDKILNDKN